MPKTNHHVVAPALEAPEVPHVLPCPDCTPKNLCNYHHVVAPALEAPEVPAPEEMWFLVEDGQLTGGPYFRLDRAEDARQRYLEDCSAVADIVRYVRAK